MKYTFCTIDNGAGTAWLRAGMLVKFMIAEKKREAKWVFGQNNIKESLKSANKDDCYIFIKTGFDDNTIFLSKEKCGKIILDISDDFSETKTKTWVETADAVLYDTDFSNTILEYRGYRNRLKINHLHSNFDDNFNQIRKKSTFIKKIGYLGVQKQLDRNQDLISLINVLGLGWYQANPNYHNNILHTIELDLKIIYNENTQNQNLKIKPHNKMMNAYSFGIPVLFSPYDSYVETVKNSELLSEFCCKDFDELKQKLMIILKNEQLYQKSSEECFSLSRNYHVSKYESCYKKLFEFIEQT